MTGVPDYVATTDAGHRYGNLTDPLNLSILNEIGLGVVVALAIWQAVENWELFRSARRIPKTPITGSQSFLGRTAEVVEPYSRLAPTGTVFGTVRIDGELWRAMMIKDIDHLPQAGQRVRIVGREDLVLESRARGAA